MIRTYFFAVSIALTGATQAADKPAHLFILSGQSNMQA